MNVLFDAVRGRFSSERSRWLLVLGLLLLAEAFVGNATTALWDQDEAAYAGFAREMLRTGDWVVPKFLTADVHRKPPLLFWLVAVSFKVFGDSELALRLPTTLAVATTIACVGLLTAPLIGARAARYAALALATSLFIPNLGKVAVTDSLVLLCDTLVAVGLWRFLDEPRWRWSLMFWGGLALGLLAKGPPTLILAVGLFLFVWATDSRHRALLRLQPWFLAPLAVAPFAVWVALAWKRTDGALIRWMWSWYVERRATGGTVFGQRAPPGFHFAVMFVGLLPWSAVLPLALSRWRDLLGPPRLRFLMGWLLFGWLVWEVMPSKLPAYAIGGYPAAAILIGRELDGVDLTTWRLRALRWSTWLAGLLIVALGVGVAVLFELHPELTGPTRYWGYAALAGLVLTLAFYNGARALSLGDGGGAAKSFTLAGCSYLILAWSGLVPAIEAQRAIGRRVADAVRAFDGLSLPVIYGADLNMPSIPYYVGRKQRTELALKSDQELRDRFKPCSPGVYVLKRDQLLFTGGTTKSARIDGWTLDGPKPLSLRVLLVTCEPRSGRRQPGG